MTNSSSGSERYLWIIIIWNCNIQCLLFLNLIHFFLKFLILTKSLSSLYIFNLIFIIGASEDLIFYFQSQNIMYPRAPKFENVGEFYEGHFSQKSVNEMSTVLSARLRLFLKTFFSWCSSDFVQSWRLKQNWSHRYILLLYSFTYREVPYDPARESGPRYGNRNCLQC